MLFNRDWRHIISKKIPQQSGLGLLSLLASRWPVSGETRSGFEEFVVSKEEGEAWRLRDGSAIVRVKIAKAQGPVSISFLSESFVRVMNCRSANMRMKTN
jgi:hypothetical protein